MLVYSAGEPLFVTVRNQ